VSRRIEIVEGCNHEAIFDCPWCPGGSRTVITAPLLWTGRFCIQHLAEVYQGDTECDYADEWADEEMRCVVRSVLIVPTEEET
jgi:hypothetical protein